MLLRSRAFPESLTDNRYFSIPALPIIIFLLVQIPVGPWGTASPSRFNLVGGFGVGGISLLAFVVNTPQLLISWFYLTYNNIFTSMAIAYEYNQFGAHRKGLRVSKPEGEQRETYFLQLPLRWAVPLNAGSGLLHWLASQTIFVVRLDHVDHNGIWTKTNSVAACGFSSAALLTLLLVQFALLVFILVVASIPFTEHVPFSGSCSWVISAACHPPAHETDPALERVQWGVVAESPEANDGPKHCSFSSGPVKKPKVGRI